MCAAADDMQPLDGERSKLFQVAQHLSVAQGKTLEDAACLLLIGLGKRLMRLPTVRFDGFHHTWGIGKAWVVRIDDAAEGGCRHCRLVDVVHVGWRVCPFLTATLQEPHAADVLKEARRALYAAFVGEVILIALLVDDGLLRLDTEQTPSAATEIGEVLILCRDCCHSGSRIMACHSNHRHRTEPRQLLHFRRKGADDIAGIDISPELASLHPDGAKQVGVYLFAARIEELRGGENRVFADSFSREHVHQGIWHKEHLVGSLQS